MKIFVILCACALLFSCSNQDDFVNKTNAKMVVSEAKLILKNLEDDLKVTRPNFKIKFTSSEVLKINNDYYLRAYSGDYISTTLLVLSNNGNLVYGKISCTSSACSNTDGCIPSPGGKSCTSCVGPFGDCVKTVTSGELPLD